MRARSHSATSSMSTIHFPAATTESDSSQMQLRVQRIKALPVVILEAAAIAMILLHQGFFGWRVVAAAFTIAAFAWGVGFYGPPVFLRTLNVDRGWSIATISVAISTHFLFSAGLIAYLSDLQRRFGIVTVTRVGAIALSFGALAWAFALEPWQLFAAALLSGAGWAMLSGAAINAIVSPWFERKRPAAIAMAFNGASVGGVLFTPLWVLLIASVGFKSAAVIIGAAMIAALWWLAGRYLRPTPAALGTT